MINHEIILFIELFQVFFVDIEFLIKFIFQNKDFFDIFEYFLIFLILLFW
jgi:hypothetical protein